MSSLDHVGLSVANLHSAASFYDAAFGFASEFEFELPTKTRGAMLVHPSGARLELFQHPDPAPGLQGRAPLESHAFLGYGHFALSAPQIESMFERALGAGARAVVRPGPSPEPGVRFAFLADPEGNLVELVERPGA